MALAVMNRIILRFNKGQTSNGFHTRPAYNNTNNQYSK
jgi:hypothetical protein